jgi:hypothetical protein
MNSLLSKKIPENSIVDEKAILTIATSKKMYVDMACNLAMSFLLWNDPTEIKFSIITDCPQFIPQKLKEKISIIEISPGELGEGFSAKLHIERFSPARHTLFIDSDCLVYGNLNTVFDLFKGRSLSAIGYKRYEGLDVGFCNDISKVIAYNNIEYFPLLCGSVYYFEHNDKTSRIFDHARSLVKTYHDMGLISLRGKENEEPLMAISMAKFNEEPVNDTGFVKADRMFYEYLETNIIRGKARLWNEKNIPVPEYSILKEANPLIVHFNAAYAESFEYESEVFRIKKVFLQNWNKEIANIYAYLTSTAPGKFKKTTKDILRPVYKSIFGHRKIKTSNRI